MGKRQRVAPWVGNIPNKYFFLILDTILRKKVFYGIAVKFQLFFIEQFEFFDGFWPKNRVILQKGLSKIQKTLETYRQKLFST